MGKTCAVYGCMTTTRDKIAFHCFPKDKIRCKQWKKACSRDDLNKKSEEELHASRLCICDLHFERSSIFGKKLKCNAVPTLRLPQIDESGFTKSTQTDLNVPNLSSACSKGVQTCNDDFDLNSPNPLQELNEFKLQKSSPQLQCIIALQKKLHSHGRGHRAKENNYGRRIINIDASKTKKQQNDLLQKFVTFSTDSKKTSDESEKLDKRVPHNTEKKCVKSVKENQLDHGHTPSKRARLDNSEKPVDSSEEPFDNSEEPVNNSEEPVGNAEEPEDNSEEPVDNTEEPVDNTEKPVYSDEWYEFGKLVAEILMCLDIEEARVAQKGIEEVLSRFMNKILSYKEEPSTEVINTVTQVEPAVLTVTQSEPNVNIAESPANVNVLTQASNNGPLHVLPIKEEPFTEATQTHEDPIPFPETESMSKVHEDDPLGNVHVFTNVNITGASYVLPIKEEPSAESIKTHVEPIAFPVTQSKSKVNEDDPLGNIKVFTHVTITGASNVHHIKEEPSTESTDPIAIPATQPKSKINAVELPADQNVCTHVRIFTRPSEAQSSSGMNIVGLSSTPLDMESLSMNDPLMDINYVSTASDSNSTIENCYRSYRNTKNTLVPRSQEKYVECIDIQPTRSIVTSETSRKLEPENEHSQSQENVTLHAISSRKIINFELDGDGQT